MSPGRRPRSALRACRTGSTPCPLRPRRSPPNRRSSCRHSRRWPSSDRSRPGPRSGARSRAGGSAASDPRSRRSRHPARCAARGPGPRPPAARLAAELEPDAQRPSGLAGDADVDPVGRRPDRVGPKDRRARPTLHVEDRRRPSDAPSVGEAATRTDGAGVVEGAAVDGEACAVGPRPRRSPRRRAPLAGRRRWLVARGYLAG